MVDVRPFAALRYAGVSPQDVGEVSSPPYDVFTPEMQMTYHARHPHNVVRLIQAEANAGETGDEGRIGRAAEEMARWRKEGILVPDPAPAIYPYRQVFTTPFGFRYERRSFFAAVRLEPYGEGRIFPHEQTFSKPKGYLFDLWGKCGAHLGPIFSFFDDPEAEVDHALIPCMDGPPIADFVDEDVRHTLWRCEDPAAVEAIQKALASREIYIADGHHRYETSLDLMEAAHARGAAPGGEADYTLMCLASMMDPGMIVLPAYRLVKKLGAPVEEALARLAERYDVIEEPAPAAGKGPAAAQRLRALAEENGERPVFCLYDGKGPLRFLIRKENAPGGEGDAAARAVAELDVSRLHDEVIEGALAASSHDEADIAFTPDPEEALAAARSGECEAALLLNPTPIDDVSRIALAGGRMPHKSTYFFPKLRTGLVIHAFAPPAADGG